MENKFSYRGELFIGIAILSFIVLFFIFGFKLGIEDGIQFSPCENQTIDVVNVNNSTNESVESSAEDFDETESESEEDSDESNDDFDDEQNSEDQDYFDDKEELDDDFDETESESEGDLFEWPSTDNRKSNIDNDPEEEEIEFEDKNPNLAPKKFSFVFLGGIGFWISLVVIALAAVGAFYAGFNWKKWKRNQRRLAIMIVSGIFLLAVAMILGMFLGTKNLVQFSPCDDILEYHCGNGIIEGKEICDGNSKECGGGFGVETCNENCTGFSSCIIEEICGNNIAQGGEECDGTDLNNNECTNFGYTTGTLNCLESCTFDYNECKNDTVTNEVDENQTESSNTGLVAYYSFNDGTAKDYSGYGNDGELINNPTLVTGPENFGNALNFAGDGGLNQYIKIENNPILQISSEITLVGWVKPESFSQDQRVIQKRHTSIKSSYGMFVDNGEIQLRVTDCELKSKDYNSDNTIPLNTWSHIAVTFDDTLDIVKIYINGDNVKSFNNAIGSICESNSENLEIGGVLQRENRWFNGTIDDVRIYNKVLSDEEIMELI